MKYTILAKKGCPYCKGALSLIREIFKDGDIIEVNYEDEDFTRNEFKEKFGKDATYPRVYFGSRFIGGYDDLQEYLDGKP